MPTPLLLLLKKYDCPGNKTNLFIHSLHLFKDEKKDFFTRQNHFICHAVRAEHSAHLDPATRQLEQHTLAARDSMNRQLVSLCG